jgi:surface protein
MGCDSLTTLDLSSFDTTMVEDMTNMFWGCDYLTSLNLSDRFVTTNAKTDDMFIRCPAGDDWGHLLN